MVVSPRTSHSFGVDVVGHYVIATGERHLTDGTLAALLDDLAVEQLSHFSIGAELAISPGVVRVVDTLNAEPSDAPSLLERLAATAIEGSMDGTIFLATEFHQFSSSGSFCGTGKLTDGRPWLHGVEPPQKVPPRSFN
jgi:hypothetical protein